MIESAPAGTLRDDAFTLVKAAWRLNPRRLVVQVTLLLLSGVVGGIGLLLLIPIVNAVANPDSTVHIPVLGSVSLGHYPLWSLLLAFVLLAVVQAVVMRSSTINTARMQQEIVDSLRQQAFDAVLAARWSFILQRRRSDIIEVVTLGATRSGLAFQQLLQGSVSLVLALATAVVAIIVAPTVALLAIVGVVLVGALQLRSVKPAHQLGRLFGERNRHLQSVMTDSMDSLRLIRAHNASPVWSQRLTDAFTDARAVQVANAERQATVTAVSSITLAAAAALLVLVAVALGVSPTSLVVILLLLARLTRLVQSLTGTIAILANLLPGVGDLTTLTADARAAVEVTPRASSMRTENVNDSSVPLLEFRDVTFRYPDSDNGVSDISFSVPRGEITALTGHSGAGKSTTADLTLGLLTPQEGTVLADGLPLIESDLSWWRDRVAYVPQETVLIPGTLRDNLVWSARSGVTDAECWQALTQAAATFASELPDGLDTVLGDRGLRLSGGERQRVAIARALLRQPLLLVLDEATSSLDDQMESAVLDLLHDLVPAVTVLVIAHRHTTIDAAAHIVRFERGRVVTESH